MNGDRRREAAAYAAEHGNHAAAARFGLSASVVANWRRRLGYSQPRNLGDTAGTVSGQEAARLADVSYRQLDYWDRCGVVVASVRPRGSGTYRGYTDDDLAALRVAADLVTFGMASTALLAYSREQRVRLRDAIAAIRQEIQEHA